MARTSTKTTKATKSTKASTKKTAAKKPATKKTTKTSSTKKATAKKATKTTKASAKKTTTKKTAAKKTSTKKATTTKAKKASLIKKVVYKQSAQEKKLVKELNTMAGQMDAEGLLFLIEQARVHLYNMEVVALQAEVNAINKKKASLGSSTQESGNETHEFSIQASSDGHTYHVIYNGKWKMINAEELLRILKIVNAPIEADEVRLNVLHWFFKERADFVGDFGLTDTHDPRWIQLIELFQKSFSLNI